MKPILTICPSRERPDRIKVMMDSFYATSMESLLVVVVDKDDPTIEKYRELNRRCHLFSLEETNLASNTERINETFKKYAKFDFYHITNDDVVYRTQSWDEHFMNVLKLRKGIAFGNDLMFNKQLCPTPFISGDIARALGWLQLPTLTHLYGDNVWMIIGKLLGNIFYFDEVVIEHMHPVAGKAEMDEVYRADNSEEMYKRDSEAFFAWCAKEALGDVKRISKHINQVVTAKP